MKFLLNLVFGTALLLSYVNTNAQEYVPKDYLKPKHYMDIKSAKRFETEVKEKPGKRSKQREEWFVISDRNSNYTYASKSLGADKVNKLNFRDIAYVAEDHTGWVKLATAPEGGSDLGWIPKANVLQWRRGLLDANTGINLKGFILNKLKDIKIQKLEFAEVYDAPVGGNSIGKISLHDFYFIFKVQKGEAETEQRYLLSTNNEISSRTIDYLKGWVDVKKITEWNTRLSLEPNFTMKGFKERSGNEKFEVKGFATQRQSEKITTGEFARVDERAIYWNGDPVKTDKGVAKNSHDNPRRFLGEQIRFPLLKNNESSYSSGILATISNQSSNTISGTGVIELAPEVVQDIKDRNSNLNLVFVMEGGDEVMSQYSKTVRFISGRMLDNAQYSKVKISVGIYKDILESEEAEFFKFLPPTDDVNKVVSFLDSNFWGKSGDFEEMTCWKYGLYKSIKESNLKPNATNVVIHLGNYADFSIDEFRVEDAPRKYQVDRKDLRELFSKYDINWIVANVQNNDNFFSDEFNDNIRESINDITKEIYTEYSKEISGELNKARVPVPSTPKLDEGLLISTKNFITKNRFLRCDSNDTISPRQLDQFLTESLDEINESNQSSLSSISDGNKIEVDANNMEFTPEVIGILRKQLNAQLGVRLTDDEVVGRIKDTKLFADIYFPKKQPTQVYNPFSIVLFMPENDLKSYVKELNLLSLALDLAKDKTRVQLQKTLTEMARKFSAADLSDVSNMEAEEVFDLMVGIKREGFDVVKGLEASCKIKDLKNKKKCSDEAITKMGDSIVGSKKRLEGIIKSKPPYEFKYSTDENNTYYWIPVEYMYSGDN